MTGIHEPEDHLPDRQRALRLLLHDGGRLPPAEALDRPRAAAWLPRLRVLPRLRFRPGARASGRRHRGPAQPHAGTRGLARSEGPMKALYVTDRSAIGEDRFAGVLDRLAGARGLAVTLREGPAGDRDLVALAREVRGRLGDAVPLYVHRRFDLALAAGAAGVHLPSTGLPLPAVRAGTPRGFRVGVSTHAASEAEEAIADGADFLVIGPV